MANLQRAAKRQPGGGFNRLGTTPGNGFEARLARCRRVDARDRADQALRVGVLRIGEQRLDRRFLDHLAGIHHDDALRRLGDHAHRMGDQHDRHAEARFHVLQQFEDLRLDRHVERGGRLVGDQQLRAARERHRDHDALAHAAGELMRIVVHALVRIGDLHQAQHLDGLVERRALRKPLVPAQHLGDLLADGVDRIERGHRLLEHHRDVLGADAVHLAGAERRKIAALIEDLPGDDFPGRHCDRA